MAVKAKKSKWGFVKKAEKLEKKTGKVTNPFELRYEAKNKKKKK